jgi:hypothetical protein
LNYSKFYLFSKHYGISDYTVSGLWEQQRNNQAMGLGDFPIGIKIISWG